MNVDEVLQKQGERLTRIEEKVDGMKEDVSEIKTSLATKETEQDKEIARLKLTVTKHSLYFKIAGVIGSMLWALTLVLLRVWLKG